MRQAASSAVPEDSSSFGTVVCEGEYGLRQKPLAASPVVAKCKGQMGLNKDWYKHDTCTLRMLHWLYYS